MAAAFVKGSIGFGFPVLGTPLLSLVLGVKAAVVVLIIPNIIMDGLQFIRNGASIAVIRRFAILLVFGAVGTVIGTRLLVVVSSRMATLVLGAFLLAFAILGIVGVKLRVSPRWEPWVSPVAGLIAGIVGGISNVPGTPLVIYFHALGMEKREFLSSVAYTFVVYKVIQLGAVIYFGLMSPILLGYSLGLVVAALAAFAGGLKVQDRLDQRAFNRALLVFLAVFGVWLVWRNL